MSRPRLLAIDLLEPVSPSASDAASALSPLIGPRHWLDEMTMAIIGTDPIFRPLAEPL
jgi:hypothetical protein